MKIITQSTIENYVGFLRYNEKSPATVEKYKREIGAFACFLGGEPVTKERAVAYKEHLKSGVFKVSSVNVAIAALNGFFEFLGLNIKLKTLKVQHRPFTDPQRELTYKEYGKLTRAADTFFALIIRTICSTGIRVTELQYITVEAVKNGRVEISLKGKVREILIPRELRRMLKKYIYSRREIKSGPIFLTKDGECIGRSSIWYHMKRIAAIAGVAASKVFPHNLRKLFARRYYDQTSNITELADLLGHSDINTTRIYVATSGSVIQGRLDRLKLVI